MLDKPLYLTFESEAEGDSYAARLDALLDRGIVPTEHRADARVSNIEQLARLFQSEAHPSDKDRSELDVIAKRCGTTPLAAITTKWVDDWISDMKRIDKLAPTSIRAKVGALARCTDWGMRKGLLTMPDHPLRTLPEGYAQYSKNDEALAGVKRVDVERDRRLEEGEFDKALARIELGVLPRKQRPRPLEFQPAVRCAFVVAVETAMRMREQYTLEVDQVDLARSTIFLDKTKNGDKRQVPLSSVAKAELQAYLKVRTLPAGAPANLLYPWWNGESSKRELARTTHFLSKLYGSIFETEGFGDLTFHDLRHEATSRLFERTKLSEAQIMKITGHRSHRMMMRYANLRGSDLATHLW
ncbi:MAG: site-specific integrase [Roseateles sp.]|uniref:site-specific integrase n=1 Tax=Roseateles sp. TaxID=1971397 RepID=UPI0040368E19